MSGCQGQCGCEGKGDCGGCSKSGGGGCSGDCANCPNKKRREAEASLTALVRQVVVEVVRELEAAEGGAVSAPVAPSVPSGAPEAPRLRSAPLGVNGGGEDARAASGAEVREETPLWSRGPKHRALPAYRSLGAAEAIREATPARLLQGRTGTRYLTESYLGLRADHAIAIDAVASEVPEAWVAKLGWLPLRTRAKDKQEYLLHPDQGRQLDDASKQACAQAASSGVDVQLIAGDGLSAVALMTNGPATIAALQRALPAVGLKVGAPLFVRFARIGVQDEIGVLTRARCTLILVGERPGLGTGDSLSIYTAFGPRLGQDNSEKDCISNVRSLGFPPEAAAAKCAELLKRTFAAGGGGMKLTGPSGGAR